MRDGIGLAASQVGLPLRIYVAYDRLEENERGELQAYINPFFEPKSILSPAGEIEGCLSFPGIRGEVMRPENGKLSYINEAGEQVEEQVKGLKARCAQHEIDHLNGFSIHQTMTVDSLKKAQTALNRLSKSGKKR